MDRAIGAAGKKLPGLRDSLFFVFAKKIMEPSRE